MSGGSHGYVYSKIEYELCNQMEDAELNDLIQDIVTLAKALEWYHSGDTEQDSYRKEVLKFKKKWSKRDRDTRLKGYIDKEIEELKENLYTMIGRP